MQNTERRKTTLPLIDVAKYYTHKAAFVEELRAACHTVGFFLIRHNLERGLADDMLNESCKFFQRPLRQKYQISYEQSSSFRGYMQMGVENTAGTLDHREQIEYAVEYPDSANSKSDWPAYDRLKSPTNPWPTNFQPSLQPTTMKFARQVCHVADCIRDSLCLALNLDPNVLSEMFEHPNEVPHWVIKMISYPPCPQDASSEQQGVGAHTDTNFLTLVLQDQIGGLQAFSRGKWVDVPTEYGSDVLVCNLGEQAEIWSRGYFLATPHRVLRNKSSQESRISVPLFYNPTLSATIHPLEESVFIGSEIPWDRTRNVDHWRQGNNVMLSSVGDNTFKSLARSHPGVFRKHHPDLKIQSDGQIIRVKKKTS